MTRIKDKSYPSLTNNDIRDKGPFNDRKNKGGSPSGQIVDTPNSNNPHGKSKSPYRVDDDSVELPKKTNPDLPSDKPTKPKKKGPKFEKPDVVEPQESLIPRGGPFYSTPNTPADPRDCDRFPNSPWCGENPMSNLPVGIEPAIVHSDCMIGIQLEPTIGFVKGPPVQIVYKYKNCEEKPPLPDPDWYQELPPESLPNMSISCKDGQGILATTFLSKEYSINHRFLLYKRLFKWIYQGYGYSYKKYIGRKLLQVVRTPDPEDTQLRYPQPLRNLDIRMPSPLSKNNIANPAGFMNFSVLFDYLGHSSRGWNVGNRALVPAVKLQDNAGINGIWQQIPGKPIMYIEGDGCRFYHGQSLDLQNLCNDINSTPVNVWKSPFDVYLGPLDAVEVAKKFFYTENDDDNHYLWRQLMSDEYIITSKGTDIKKFTQVILSSSCTVEYGEPPILIEKEKECECMCDDKLLKTLLKKVDDLEISMRKAIVTIGPFPIEIDIKDSDPDKEGDQPQKIVIDTVSKYIREQMTNNNITTILGLNRFPVKLPSKLVNPNAKKQDEETIKDIPEFLGYIIKQIDKAVGKLPQKIKISDGDLAKEGDQPLEIEIHSLSDFARETLKILLDSAPESDIHTNMLIRILYELGFIHQGSIQTLANVDAMVEHMDFKHKFIAKEYPFAFNPYCNNSSMARGFGQNKQDEELKKPAKLPNIGDNEKELEKILPKFLQETWIKVRTIQNIEKKSLNADIQAIKRDANTAALAVSAKADPKVVEELINNELIKLQTQDVISQISVKKSLSSGILRTKPKPKDK